MEALQELKLEGNKRDRKPIQTYFTSELERELIQYLVGLGTSSSQHLHQDQQNMIDSLNTATSLFSLDLIVIQ